MSRRLPRLCIHKATQRYYIKIHGDRHYLGKVGGPDEEAVAEAARVRLLAEHQAGTLQSGKRKPAGVTIDELLVAYIPEAEQYYRRADGSPTQEIINVRAALRPLQRAYGNLPVSAFGPHQLEALRLLMMSGDWMTTAEKAASVLRRGRPPGRCRKTINKDVNRIRLAFRFGVRKGLVPAGVYQTLLTVDHLKQGRSAARETEDVGPAPAEAVAAVLVRVNRTVGTMLQVQQLTGARPGEVCRLRPGDIDRTGEALARLVGERIALNGVWAWIPDRHKTAHHGHKRVIPIGPRAQELLAPFLLGCGTDEYVFSPARSRDAFDLARRAARRSRIPPSQQKRRRKRNPKRKPGAFYSENSYAAAVRKACKRVGVPQWHAHQLRHAAATRLVEQFGWEVARIVLGHRTLSATRIYGKDNLQKGFDAIGEVG